MILLAVVTVALISLGIAALLQRGDEVPGQLPTATNSPSPSPRPSPAISEEQEDADEKVSRLHQEEGKTNPVLKALPYTNQQFSVTFDGSEGDKYVLLGKAFFSPGVDDPAKKAAEQRSAIINYLRSIGQPDGTYILNVEAQSVEETLQ